MHKTNYGNTTPGGRPVTENPHSSESGPMDSGGGGLELLTKNPIMDTENDSQTVFHRDFTADPLRTGFKPFYTQWQEEKKDREKLEQIVRDLQNQILLLENKIETMSKKDEASTAVTESEYHTDEEQLTRETDWILQKNKRPSKKRKAESSPELPSVLNTQETRTKKQDNATIKVATGSKKDLTEKTKVKEYDPPPIIVHQIQEYKKLKQTIGEITSEECKYTSYNNNVWKINVPNSDTYRKITSELAKKEIQWHSYEDRASRPTKVMARGLHPSCDESEICADLTNQGFKILEAKNILTKGTEADVSGNSTKQKRRLPLFMLTFHNEEIPENIYAIKAIMGIVVKIEPLKRMSNRIPQCKRCQAFGHTQRYCNKEFACVKCAGKHPTRNCTLTRDQKPKCINCRGEHPASYRGCIIAKEQQKRKDQLNYKNTSRNPVPKPTPKLIPNLKPTLRPIVSRIANTKTTGNNELYAEVVKKSAQVRQRRGTEEMLDLILKRLDEQDDVIKTLSSQLNRVNKKSK